MKKLVIILGIFIMACSNDASHEGTADKHEHQRHAMDTAKAAEALHLNNRARWKTDEVTRKNVGTIVRLINDTSNVEKKSREQVTRQLQTMIDTLVSQCTMKGPDHDALHLWLGHVLRDLKEMKEQPNDDAYQRSYAVLKKGVENFYLFFE